MSTLARERSLPTIVILITYPDHNTSHFTKKWRKRYFVLYTPKEPYDKKNSMLMYFDDEISCQKVCVVRVSGWKGERVWTLPKRLWMYNWISNQRIVRSSCEQISPAWYARTLNYLSFQLSHLSNSISKTQTWVISWRRAVMKHRTAQRKRLVNAWLCGREIRG